MNLLDAITTLLDATVEMEDRPKIKQARKRLQQRADALRKKRERMVTQKCNCGGTDLFDKIIKCELPQGHDGPHRKGVQTWERVNWGKA